MLKILNSSSKLHRQLAATILLFFVGDAVDYLENVEFFQVRPILRALLDTGGHLFIGLLTLTIVNPQPDLRDIIFVALASSVMIDIDHFISARSFHAKHALRAPSRGILHCTGLLVVVNLVISALQPQLALLLLISYLPHHVRDGGRRGLYLTLPYVHTPPLPQAMVRGFLVIFPWLIFYLRNYFSSLEKVQIQGREYKELIV